MVNKTDIPTTVAIKADRHNNIASIENKFGFQSELRSCDRDRKNRSNNLIELIFKTRTVCEQGIHPRLFCRRWFGLEATNENGRPRFTEGQIEAMESEYGYREKCINLIARLLKIKPNTIHRWGKGLSFDKIPQEKLRQYEIYLGYIDAIRVMTASLTELDEASLLRLLRQLETRE